MYTAVGTTRLFRAMLAGVLIRMVPVALALVALPVSAQSTPGAPVFPGDNLVAITIVLVDNGAPTGLLRRDGVQPQNVILMDSATVSAQVLSNAVFSMLLMEAVDATGQRRGNNELRRANLSAPRSVYPWAGDVLSQLQRAAKEPVRGVGRYRSVAIWVPRLRGRQP